MSLIEQAAIFYLRYQGQKGTPKQVARLLRTVGPAVFRMAESRGWKSPQ